MIARTSAVVLTTCIALALIFAAAVSAAELISYQGRLETALGSPVADGIYTVTFRIYPDSTGGSLLWSETADVTTSGGLFSHLLGSGKDLSADLFAAHDEVFLELDVDGNVLSPRTRLTSSPRSAVAGHLRIVDDRGVTVGYTAVDSGGEFYLNDTTGTIGIALRAGLLGDSAVVLPDSSVSSLEIRDEPGIASSKNTSLIDLSTGTMTDLAVAEITIPDDGFIVLYGKCYALLSGTTGPNGAQIQIDSTEGGSALFPYYQRVGMSGFVNTGINYFPVFTTRVFYRGAGTHEFRLEGIATHPLPAVAQTWDHILTAVYYPSGYGWVSQIVPSPGNHPGAVPVELTGPGRSGTVYDIDLRPAGDSSAAHE